MTKPSKTRKTFTRNTFAEHNYNYVHQSKTNHPPPPEKIHKIETTFVLINGIFQIHRPIK